MNLDLMLLLHKMLLSNIRDEIAGRFRSKDEWVRVANHIAADPKEVVDRLEKMLINYYSKPDFHIVKKIAHLHLTFEYIHPFVDGNGRIGRILNDFFFNS